jgi:YidC/Oxa1 family membrane protein insertase
MFTTIFVQPLFNLLFLLYGLLPGHDLGMAVIGLTVIVRLLLWPLVSRQLHSQRLMQRLAPEVAKIRQQAAGDRQKETQMLMELYKERGTSPFAPLLPLLIQLPIFFALYIVFKDAVDPHKIVGLTYNFIEQIPAVAQVIADPSKFSPTLFGVIDLTKPNVFLAVLAGLAQWYQARMLQPKRENMDSQARMMSSLTYVFPIITIVVGLRLPSALSLYWAVTSLVAALQQYLILKRDATEMEAAADKREAKAKLTKGTSPAAAVASTTEEVPANPKTARKRARRSGRKGGVS